MPSERRQAIERLRRTTDKRFDQDMQEIRDQIDRDQGRQTLAAYEGRTVTAANVPEIQGTPNERLVPGQSMTEWTRRAAENGVTVERSKGSQPVRVQHHSNEYLNAYWGQRLGFAASGAELRALGEDTSGSGQAITPQSWTASFIDYLYPLTVLGGAGITRVPMSTELVNVPQFTAPVQPAWLAENSGIGIDTSPAFSTLQLSATGGFKDITLYSMELAQDAYISGGLPGMLAESAARKFALAVDASGLIGITGNAGCPGLVNETGFVSRQYTGAAGSGKAPADTTEFSIVNELIANKNTNPTAILSNPSTYGTIVRTNASTYAKFWDMPRDVADLPWLRSANPAVFPTTETSTASPALTGGSYSSFYMGPFYRMLFGIHMDLSATVLRERYVDYAQFGLFHFARWSIRTGHPEAFVRTTSIITT
jgi:HK97 family phage major capsid protein